MKVGVCGAGGRMGREVCRAVMAEDDMELVCAYDPAFSGSQLDGIIGADTGLVVEGSKESLQASGAEAMVDFTVAGSARENVSYALESGINCVVGTTGFDEDDLNAFDEKARSSGAGCLVAPNFAIGAVLMMEFARRASRFLQDCEIVELHHPAKIDAPSGTARNTARLILEARGGEAAGETEEGPRGLNVEGIHIHSVRLPGLVAHQEVIFGGRGQTLSIRHDSIDRSSFMPGVIMGLRKVPAIEGLLLGLDKIMEL